MRRLSVCLCLYLTLSIGASLAAADGELPEREVLRGWIADMKARDRGPFLRLRWFCADGAILEPKAYACKDHGGGAQHGEWTDRTKLLRDHGYKVANILSGLDIPALVKRPGFKDLFGQILIEQFLIRADDGWILRKARYYRGALQEEGERGNARILLFNLAAEPAWWDRGYLMLRTGAQLLSHGPETASVKEVRQLSASLSAKVSDFMLLRNKIHGTPDAGDAAAVRSFAARLTEAEQPEFFRLAEQIDEIYARPSMGDQLRVLAEAARDLPGLAKALRDRAVHLDAASTPAGRFEATAALLALLRDSLAKAGGPKLRMAMIDASLELEDRHFTAGVELAKQVGNASRVDRLLWLTASAQALYGVGLISGRQREALLDSLGRIYAAKVDLKSLKEVLDYLALVPGWSSRWLRFQFGDMVDKLSEIEPLAELFPQDQLRGSPLFFFAQVLDGLLRDTNRLAGVTNQLFGEDVGAGLRSLNPGLARGRLHLAAGELEDFESDGIYLLPETVAELPPVAGILTLGEGNPLSHIQLLARNLGIPNVALDEALVEKLRPAEGRRVILAVSPTGSVRLFEDEGQGGEILGETEAAPEEVLIRPDLEKLDLKVRDLLPLSSLRAEDSGRTVGPKAAKLGELKHAFPRAVDEGLTIPFGVFRALLERPYGTSGMSVYDWMVGEYRRLETLPVGAAQRRQETEAFRGRLYDWIRKADPGEDFRRSLKAAMEQAFGPDGSYGVFVRSDTNVEDLPGFTGAGLNLTVPNVVGFDSVLAAIPRVWASPFTARAFAWRQSHMEQPEHVYPAILLLRSVPADKSGVLVTQDIDRGDRGWLSVAVNEGVGGAVDGQAAESLRIRLADGEVKLMSQATATTRRQLRPSGGVDKLPVSGADRVLVQPEIAQLISLARTLPERFPAIVDADGKPAPADIEFGFENGDLRLFQIRPFLESKKAHGSAYLRSLDLDLDSLAENLVRMDEIPGSETP